jgi:hypothetical protein
MAVGIIVPNLVQVPLLQGLLHVHLHCPESSAAVEQPGTS